ncbi:hypothetical protein AB0F17_36825 [Nonomuraea sp. NPDC026600]
MTPRTTPISGATSRSGTAMAAARTGFAARRIGWAVCSACSRMPKCAR